MTASSSWLPMEIAPRDRRITIQAERWVAGHERMRVEAFTACKWCEGGSVRHPTPYWRRVPTGWTPTGWRDAERGPGGETARYDPAGAARSPNMRAGDGQ